MSARHTAFLATALTAALGFPGAALAATATVTGDAGQALALGATATSIRNMSPSVTPVFDAADRRYSLTVTGPDGYSATLGAACAPVAGATDVAQAVKYAGNGTYTVKVAASPDENDIYCDQAGAGQTYSFAINASTLLSPPATTLMSRKPGNTTPLEHLFAVADNPGAGAYGIVLLRDGKVAADGGLPGGTEVNVDAATRKAGVQFPQAGTYTLVARAFAGAGASPFSPPVTVKVVAPFDFASEPYLRDSRGPGYWIDATLREQSATGLPMTISIADPKGPFRTLGTVKIRSRGNLRLKFNFAKRGRFRVRLSFKGSPTLAAGTITRTLTFR